MHKERVTAVPPHIQSILEERDQLRARKEFERADALRDRLEAEGYLVEDTPEGTALYRALPAGPLTVASQDDVPNRLEQPAETDFSIVYVARRNFDEIERGVSGALQWAGPHRVEVIVVENASSDETRPRLVAWAERDPRIHVILTDEELGEAEARNCGFRYSSGEIIVSHGSSVEIVGDVFGQLREVLSRQEVGLVGGWGLVTESVYEFEPAEGGEVDAVEAYFMAARRGVLREAGLWDPGFRFYRIADLDWSFAVRKAGYGLRMLPRLPLKRHPHRVWESLDEEERERLSKRNFYRFLDRWRHEDGFRLVCGLTPHEASHRRPDEHEH